MQFYECLCVCTVIAAASGILRSFVRGMDVSVFELLFVAAATAAMGSFSVFPLPELRCNAAVVFLPCCFLVFSLDAKGKSGIAAMVWRTLFVSSMLPLMGTLVSSLYEWIVNRYASVNLASVELRNSMAFFSAAALLMIRLHLTAQHKKQLV